MGHGVDSEAAGWVTDYMVITNNYRTYERGRREEEEEGLRRRRSRTGNDAANKLPEPLSGVSRVCRHQRVFGFDFLVHHRARTARRARLGRRIDGLSESGYIVKVSVETNSARMSEV